MTKSNLNRRNFITGLGLFVCAAPAIVPYKSLMPVKLFEPVFDPTQWTVEISQDLKAIHGLDVEEELSKMLAEECRKEIDTEIIKTLRYGNPPAITPHPHYPYSVWSAFG